MNDFTESILNKYPNNIEQLDIQIKILKEF